MAKTFNNLFLSIGAMKAGTTWLYAVLAQHPALYFALEKEIHYFYHKYVDKNMLSEKYRLAEAKNRYLMRYDPEKANIDAIQKNLHWVSAYLDRPVDDFWYRNLFQMRDREIYACDFSNLNAQLPVEAWPQISAKCDNLRVLYTMRDPIKRLWSHTKFHLQITGGADKLNSWGPDDFNEFVRRPHIWRNAEYGQVLRTLREGLEPQQRKVIFYEDIHADQRGTLRQIEEFLRIPAFKYPQAILDRRFTESIKHEMPAFFPELFAEDIRRIRGEIEAEGFTLPEKWG
ncbi:sulfotransferase family protein [Sulfitobacter alexandrii]|uniref:Sulfotransferase family protein n=1 Tax=Sulfitobacter alexandrii TaxID=1917485 RepID=A0A1J0WLA2_9RHOB|nr:sulfotransferase [Sulfitobacter alexandrii]APE45051.1 sulfotransferase family protein [Sulfitobacter alexandrii]